MKVIQYSDAESTYFDNDVAKTVTGRVVIGQADGAENFCMRVFEVAPDGFSPRHTHEWEHEIFFHAGTGEIFRDGEWLSIKAGSIAFVPGGEDHQIRNTGTEKLVFVCLIPNGAPEM